MDVVLSLALKTISLDKQAIIFAPSRASAEKTAEELAKKTTRFLPELGAAVTQSVGHPTKQCERLASCVQKGIAFHHSGLTSKQKELVEEEFRKGTVRIICATPTIAAGLSLPVYRVLIKSLKRYSGRWGMDWIPVLEYLQMAGRAGRPEYEKIGEAIVFARDEVEKEEIHERYICGEPEDIYSKLAAEPVLRTYLLSLIASGVIRDGESMRNFFTKTFWAHQFKDLNKLQDIMDRMILLLTEWGFIITDGADNVSDGFVVAAALHQQKNQKDRTFRATPLGCRVSELYLDPLTAHHLLISLAKFDQTKNSFSLLQMICHTLEMRPLLRVKSKEEEKIHADLLQRNSLLLQDEPSAYDIEYDEFFNSIKTALFFEAWTEERGEDFLLETFGIRPGEVRVKKEIADWLLYASEELSTVCDYSLAAKALRKLRIRVQHGVKEELLPLLRLQGIGRVRARKLYINGLRDLGLLRQVDLTTLTQILGRKIAESVKQQLGEEVKIIAKGTRKGQLSLQKF